MGRGCWCPGDPGWGQSLGPLGPLRKRGSPEVRGAGANLLTVPTASVPVALPHRLWLLHLPQVAPRSVLEAVSTPRSSL